MTQLAWLLLALAAATAVVDWLGVVHHVRRLRWVAKPLVIVFLVGVALALRPVSESQRAIWIGALFLSMVGDLFLLASGNRWFLAGLAAFLGAQLAYIDGFLVRGIQPGLLLYSAPPVAVYALLVGGSIVRALLRRGRTAFTAPVVLYMLAFSTNVALAGASGRPLALAGAALFYASDSMIGWNRFVRPLPWAELPIIVTYHAGQALLVLSLAA
jgi:uncharacterized membrane protein YhhN